MEFWDAVDKVKKKYPDTAKWTWAEWLSVIDLSDGICYHPVQFRITVGSAGKNEDGKEVLYVSGERVLDIPWILKAIRKYNYPNADDPKVEHPIITYCEVCGTFCPAPPINVKERRIKRLAKILAHVTQDD